MIKNKNILVTSTDVMMIQFLVPHVVHLVELGANVDIACSKAEGYKKEDYENKIKNYFQIQLTFLR